ncbi:periplasmic solute binding protein [Ignisphaera aggregans DSM 17230]|uniref:Periplasmic solute binding protein n=1 Tax=Ignisphaera aggregans (strain DSM 17230 / JCM 13409 / AQ1.S1) TaxID=583356 RepID=E0SRF1_IGNAA|nr:periplasmic solute binding protein [Ignisphaera aggregans DSM 17230]
MRITVISILITLLITMNTSVAISLGLANNDNGLTIVITFPWLYKDLSRILCGNDSIIYLLRPGIDPHEYMLTPSDVENLRKADIIISTAHTHFEIRIRELVDEGELKAKLIEIPSIPNITILTNPATGQPNYHALLFYPDNYIAFLEYLRNILVSTRPECSNIYSSKIDSLIDEIRNISVNTPKLDKYIAILDTLVLQYIGYWLGIRNVFIIQKEHDAPIIPNDVIMAENILKNNTNVIILTTNSSSAYSLLIEMSEKYNRPILVLPDIVATNSIIDTLEYVSKLSIQSLSTSSTKPSANLYNVDVRVLLYIIIAIAILIAIVLLYRRWVRM